MEYRHYYHFAENKKADNESKQAIHILERQARPHNSRYTQGFSGITASQHVYV
jgi:hypothetical protein